MMAMMLVMLAGMPKCPAFRAYDCNNRSAQIEQYSLLDPEPCGNMEKVHAIERDFYGEIVQIKKERLVQVTRCTASQTIKSTYCRFQSHSGQEQYDKFRDPIVIEPAACRLAVKAGQFKLNDSLSAPPPIWQQKYQKKTGEASRRCGDADWHGQPGMDAQARGEQPG
jgi:hypothetical protein